MHIFSRPLYKSEFTEFLDQLVAKDPGIEARQREGRELLWDKPVDREALQEFRAAQVAQQPYVYLNEGKQ
ncbi:DUF3460 family protein [Rhodoferax sp.]|uniref:DUF3460 family protein n=1 Tax=Rhodoferax sp. TaxID=50421 RepID=UPI0025F07D39|nr:DUF3460 family protein [Rhodoferax sp.]MCM2340879.1 DUF3460 family protein [Rhodoferax sp.]